MFSFSKLKTIFLTTLIVLLALPGINELFRSNYYTSHDGEGHIIRMDEFYRAFRDGEFPVRWSQRLYFGYGYPFFNFNYPSTYYFGVPIMAIGFSAEVAMKAELIFTFLLSGILMFWYLKGKVRPPFAVLGSLLYLYAPYRMANIFVRGSVAESAAFIFPPMLLWCIEAIANKRKHAIPLTALVIGLLGISHNISALLFFGFFFLYAIFISVQKKSIMPFLKTALGFFWGLLLASFFFVPALLEKKYTFLDQTIAKDYPNHFIYLYLLLQGGWSFGGSSPGHGGLSFNIGWVLAALFSMFVLVSTYLFWKRDFEPRKKTLFQKEISLILFCVTVLVGAIFFMLPVSKILWDHLPLLPFVQFPWRFLMLTVPVLSVLGAITLDQVFLLLPKVKPVGQWLVVAIILGCAVYFASSEWHINQVLIPQTVAGDALEGSTTWADEQATKWFVPKPNRIPAEKVFAEPALKTLQVQTWKTIDHQYELTTTAQSKVIENTMYYPGWKVFVDDKEVTINYQDQTDPGRLVFSVPAGTHMVKSVFTETPLRLSMDVLSFVTFLVLIIMLIV